MRIQSGGNLFIKSHFNKRILENSYNSLDKEKIKVLFFLKYLINKSFPKLSNKISLYKNKNLILDNPFLYRDNYFSYAQIDELSKRIFKNISINNLKKKNNTSYKYWQDLLFHKFNISPIFDINLDVNPWCISYIINDCDKKKFLINFLRNHNAVCYSWPTLPKELILSNSNALSLWKKILCISTSNK